MLKKLLRIIDGQKLKIGQKRNGLIVYIVLPNSVVVTLIMVICLLLQFLLLMVLISSCNVQMILLQECGISSGRMEKMVNQLIQILIYRGNLNEKILLSSFRKREL
nr:MAG TPA: hypothetical protein [Caudoviricetes sp.]